MSHIFARDAVRLAGVVCRALGWRPDDFWETTPAEIAAIFAIDDCEETFALSRGELEALMERDHNG